VETLIIKLPKKFWPDVEKCEVDYDNNKALFKKLIALRWEIQGVANNEKESSEVLKQKNEQQDDAIQH